MMVGSMAAAALAVALLAGTAPKSHAAEGVMTTQLKPFNVTIRRFDPTRGLDSGEDFLLPVDSPDAEHAVASTIANAASFTTKVKDGRPLPVAFTCVRVEPR